MWIWEWGAMEWNSQVPLPCTPVYCGKQKPNRQNGRDRKPGEVSDPRESGRVSWRRCPQQEEAKELKES